MLRAAFSIVGSLFVALGYRAVARKNDWGLLEAAAPELEVGDGAGVGGERRSGGGVL